VKKIDLLIVSHPHGDHYGGLIKILKIFPVVTLLVSGKEDTTEHYQRYLETVKSLKSIKFKLARVGDVYSFGDVKMLIVHPPPACLTRRITAQSSRRYRTGGRVFSLPAMPKKRRNMKL